MRLECHGLQPWSAATSTRFVRDAFKKKNFIWKEKFLSGGEGVRKKGQISLVKEQKK